MTRLTLAEKCVSYERQTVDIMAAAEQFEPWYTALNPKAVVPTLAIDGEIVTDTFRIVHRIDKDFEGPNLIPASADGAKTMDQMMRDIMGLHYGVLLYSRRLDADGNAPTVIARGEFLREQLRKYPERNEVLNSRVAGNEKMQKILAEPAEVKRHVGQAKALVSQLDRALTKTPFVSADHYTLADTFATAALARFRLHGFNSWWSGGNNPNVTAYYQRMQERSSWSAAGVVDSGNERGI